MKTSLLDQIASNGAAAKPEALAPEAPGRRSPEHRSIAFHHEPTRQGIAECRGAFSSWRRLRLTSSLPAGNHH